MVHSNLWSAPSGVEKCPRKIDRTHRSNLPPFHRLIGQQSVDVPHGHLHTKNQSKYFGEIEAQMHTKNEEKCQKFKFKILHKLNEPKRERRTKNRLQKAVARSSAAFRVFSTQNIFFSIFVGSFECHNEIGRCSDGGL